MIESVIKVPELGCDSAAATRIKALFNTYKNGGAGFYCQTAGGKTTAVMSRLGSGFTLLSFDGADFDELESFFRFFSGEVFCGAEDADKLGCVGKSIFPLLRFEGEAPEPSKGKETRISSLYGLLQMGSDGDIVLPPFEDWYTDLCARVNHGSAEFFVIDGAVAVAGFVTENAALITGVAVDKADRGMGKGSEVLRGLIAKVRAKHPDREIYAAAKSDVADFYIKNGFLICGECAVLKF